MTKLEKLEAEMTAHQQSGCPACLNAIYNVNGRVCSYAVELGREAAREYKRDEMRRRRHGDSRFIAR